MSELKAFIEIEIERLRQSDPISNFETGQLSAYEQVEKRLSRAIDPRLNKAVEDMKKEIIKAEANKELHPADIDNRFVAGAEYASRFIMRIFEKHFPELREAE